jgi:hypothetical protein
VSNIPALYKAPPIDVTKALEVAGTINRQPFMIVVDAKSPYKTLAQLTEAMKKKGYKATYGVAVTTGTVMGEIYKARIGIKAVEVNYKTASDSLTISCPGAWTSPPRIRSTPCPCTAKANCAYWAYRPASGCRPIPTCRR